MSDHGSSPSQPQQKEQPQEQPEYYRVLIPELDTVAPDPLDPDKRYHVGIFVETNPEDDAGIMFHVTGDIIAASGMRYEERRGFTLDQSARLHKATHIGWVRKADCEFGNIGTILRALPKPTKQQGINFWEADPVTGNHEIVWTKENGELYGPGEERRPVFKCNEWTSQYAVPALRNAELLRLDLNLH
ncbi:hypothetical protein BJX99DRAFT_178167 [Aspergillus californicus]